MQGDIVWFRTRYLYVALPCMNQARLQILSCIFDSSKVQKLAKSVLRWFKTVFELEMPSAGAGNPVQWHYILYPTFSSVVSSTHVRSLISPSWLYTKDPVPLGDARQIFFGIGKTDQPTQWEENGGLYAGQILRYQPVRSRLGHWDSVSATRLIHFFQGFQSAGARGYINWSLFSQKPTNSHDGEQTFTESITIIPFRSHSTPSIMTPYRKTQ